MKSYNLAKVPRVPLHSETIKHLKLGHPWVIEDSFTKKFPKDAFFIVGINANKKEEVGIFIQDPKHKTIKARFWSALPITKEFNIDLEARIHSAIEKRSLQNLLIERENILLINGESDFLPGMLVLLLKDQILIQYYSLFWKGLEADTIPMIKSAFSKFFPTINLLNLWIQERNFDQKKSIKSTIENAPAEFTLKEFNINYQIRINENYDYGLYSDMSSIRKQMLPFLKEAKSVLNLYCYTGAFSLYALSQGATDVVSVDLSGKYLNWLQENLILNPQFKAESHQSMNIACDRALKKIKEENKKFEIIICDPPSASSDGEKMTNAISAYEELLPAMLEILAPKGKIFVFLNTHQISWNKFEDKLKQIIANSKYKNEVVTGKRFKLSEDYLPIKGFHEGDYLKGILVELKK